MGRGHPIVTRADVLEQHREAPDDFVPTHRVRVVDPRSGEALRVHLVRLHEPEGPVAYARDPSGREVCGVLSTGLWQSLESHGRVEAEPVRYREEYVPVMEREGLIYFVQAGPGGPIKIGWTQNWDGRVANLQTANPERLELVGTLPGTRRDEARLHRRFAHLSTGGGEEWFRNVEEIHEFLRTAVKAL